MVLEDLLIVAALLGAFAFAHFGRIFILESPLSIAKALVLLVVLKAVFFWAGLYDFRHVPDRATFCRRLLTGLMLVAAASWVLWGWIENEPLVCGAFLVAFVPIVTLGRLAYEFLSRTGRFRKRLLFMGIGSHAQRTAREILDWRSRDYEVVGYLSEKFEEMGWRIGGKSVVGTYTDLERAVQEHDVDQVVVAVEDRRRQLPLESLLTVRLGGVEVIDEARVHEEIAGKIPVEDLRPSWLIFGEGFANSRVRQFNKRVFDIVVAALGLVLSLPITLVSALLIKLESRGPVLYRQKRVGLGGKEFTVCKFRSMRNDAEKAGQPQWAQENDPRVTRIGRFMRKTRIDEIPQMWNVLKGEMSFVGPRPERLFFVEKLREQIPFYDQRHAVKPGVTGWAQVRFRYGSDETDAIEKLRHDMFYIKHHSILFDLRILLETVRVVLESDKGR